MRRVLLPFLILLTACGGSETAKQSTAPPPSILLVTLDTTRADSIGPEARGVETPAFNALAARGRRFRQAYATAPQTLPSHASMLTGLYPAGHRVHENSRFVPETHTVAAERLRGAGYRTAAFVSAFPLARQFGLARGFDVYDDAFAGGATERAARDTTDRAIAYLREQRDAPLFIWVHYFDPHAPYAPPEEFRARYAGDPYRGEIAAMDEQLGRLVEAFEKQAGSGAAIIVAGDHGEGLGEHGEAEHGNLVYQSTMHVPLVVAGPGLAPESIDAPVSIRRVFHTILDYAGLAADMSLRSDATEVVMGESMIPFLQFGWQPQVMAVEGRTKVIHAGAIEVYDIIADPAEQNDLSGRADLSRGVRQALRDYPVPAPGATEATDALDDESRRRLASLGYIGSDVRPQIRNDAPRPRDMVHLFEVLHRASNAFAREEYARAIPLFEAILDEDPHNLMAALRLAVAHSSLGNGGRALAAFRRAERIAPESEDVRQYLALHYATSGELGKAEPMLARIVAESPERLPAVEALARIRERQGRLRDALELRRRVTAIRMPSAAELAHLAELAMAVGETALAIDSLEKARALQGDAFRHDLELGVLYLAARRFDDARRSLDRVPPSHPEYPMALFKRAQVSVLLREPDAAQRIAAARAGADATTRELIANERLFAAR